MPTYTAEGLIVTKTDDDGHKSHYCTATSQDAAQSIASALTLTAEPAAYVDLAELQGIDRFGRKNVTIWDSPGVTGTDVPLFAGAPVAYQQKSAA